MRQSKWAALARAVSFCACVGLVASACGASSASSSDTVANAEAASVPGTVAFSDDVEDAETSEDTTAATSPPAQNTTAATSLPGPSTTASTQPPSTCVTDEYEIPIPTGWYTPSSVDGSCAVFATVAVPSLECDCTVGVTVRAYPGQDAPSRVLDWMTFGAGSPTPPTSTSVFGGAATLIAGEWELSEVQAGGLGQYEQRHIYVFDDGANSVEVSAGEFQDWGGNESFTDRQAAVDQIAAGLVLQ